MFLQKDKNREYFNENIAISSTGFTNELIFKKQASDICNLQKVRKDS